MFEDALMHCPQFHEIDRIVQDFFYIQLNLGKIKQANASARVDLTGKVNIGIWSFVATSG
jgi:hypothetical protein